MSDSINDKIGITDVDSDGSKIGGVSVRGILAIILILDISILAFLKIQIPDVIANLSIAALSFYMGHQQANKTSK